MKKPTKKGGHFGLKLMKFASYKCLLAKLRYFFVAGNNWSFQDELHATLCII